MSEPEIARRCSACGLAVRQHAMFCPQCGNPLNQSSTTTSNSVSETMIDRAPAEAVRPDLTPTLPLTMVPRPKSATVRTRVEKLRKASSVVIDQAAYDPSLRFLLVAAGLFFVFLVLLILSKVLD